MSQITPDVIGYWARKHDLTWADVVMDDDLDKRMEDSADSGITAAALQASFKEGWQECDDELKAERIEALKESLADID